MNDFKEGLLQAANFTPVSLQAPGGWCGHLPFAAWLMKLLRPTQLVELGTHSGNSYFSFCQAARENDIAVKCHAVDTWQGDQHAGAYSNEVFERVSAHNEAHYGGISRLMRMTFDEAVGYFADGSVDLLHIDGLHTYEAVRHDFETWLPKLAPGAIVLFHDTNVRERGFGVWQLWQELQQQYSEHLEFVHSNGLGVLRIGGAGIALPWLRAGCAEQQELRNYFAALGDRHLARFEVENLRTHLAAERHKVAERDTLAADLNASLTERSEQLHVANLALIERDAQVVQLNTTVAERSVQLHTANLALAERDEHLNELRASLAERDAQLDQLRTVLAGREASLGELHAVLAARDEKAAAAWQALRK